MSLEERKKLISNCMRCSTCKWVPAIQSERFAHICPSAEYGKFHAYSASGMLINGYSLLEGTVPYTDAMVDSIYTCTLCGGCDVACKGNFADLVDPLDSMYALRERLASDGMVPPELKQQVQHLREVGNPLGLPPERRGAWCQGLPLSRSLSGRQGVLLHVGDAAFDEAQWPQLRYLTELLAAAGVHFAVGGADEPDSGALAFDIGYQDVATTLARQTVAWIQAQGARHIVTCSDAAFAAFRAVYPRLGVSLDGVRVQHITEWLAEHDAGAAAVAPEEVVTYHDACRLGRLSEPYEPWSGTWSIEFNSLPLRVPEIETRFGNGGVYDAPRQVLAAAGVKIVEMERTREVTYCCGAGAGAETAKPDFAVQTARRRLDEAMATGAATVVTSCGQCSRHLNRVASEDGLPLRVVTLTEFLRERASKTVSSTRQESAA
jgi:Fe-S oxidoreductase